MNILGKPRNERGEELPIIRHTYTGFPCGKCSNCGLLAYDIGVVWAVDTSVSEMHATSNFSFYPEDGGNMFRRNLTSTSKNTRCHNTQSQLMY
jgi:hypothetical protein